MGRINCEGQPTEFTENELKQIQSEFSRLKDEVYLDHAGAGLYSERQIQDITETLSKSFYCNPHTSKLTEDAIDQVRYRILRHFNTNSDAYSVIFTANATAALKSLAETFDFNYHKEAREDADIKIPGSFIYTIDNHVSVLGMREIVQTNHIWSIERNELLANVEEQKIKPLFVTRNSSLIVFPAESNFCGFKYPLELIEKIQSNGLQEKENQREPSETDWYVCLDAACYAATNSLDLNRYPADYVCISFYKMFGYPTGLGCLLVSKRGEQTLKKRYYGGGTIKVALATKNWHQKRDRSLHERFEDGTIPYLSITSILNGFQTLERLIPSAHNSMDRISQHTFDLAKYFYDSTKDLKHTTGQKLIQFYNQTNFESSKTQGGIATFLLLNNDGSFVGYSEFNCIASLHKLNLRTGCFCNPGACQRYLNLSDAMVVNNFNAGHICGDALDLVNGVPTGAVRVSFGYSSTKQDVEKLIEVIKTCFLNKNLLQSNGNGTSALNGKQMNGNGTHDPKNQIKLKRIVIFPIKSCGAFKITTKWPLNSRGLKYDREWLIVKENGVAVTQKQIPQLCVIKPIITDKYLILTHPDSKPVSVPLEIETDETESKISLCQSKVCLDNIDGDDCGDEVSDWLSNVLNTDGLRLIKQNYTKRKRFTNDKEVSLANQSQFLVLNETSIKWLAGQVDEWYQESFDEDSDKLEHVVDRFRGNLIIEMNEHLKENSIKYLENNGIRLEFDGMCTRCQMICIDQETGEKTTEPLRTLVRTFGGKMKFGVYFSQTKTHEGQFLDCSKPMTYYLD